MLLGRYSHVETLGLSNDVIGCAPANFCFILFVHFILLVNENIVNEIR